jgi:hypothetical protein
MLAVRTNCDRSPASLANRINKCVTSARKKPRFVDSKYCVSRGKQRAINKVPFAHSGESRRIPAESADFGRDASEIC